jgi:ADP-ribose pyrophosphatase YjhB (NUDIX family)
VPDSEQSYIHQLLQIRQQTGINDQFILPNVRAVIRDEEGRILLVQRSDDRRWVMPSGSVELSETAYADLRREVREECGLPVLSARLMSIYNYFPRSAEEMCQYLHFQFVVDAWCGQVVTETDETTAARFWTEAEMCAALQGTSPLGQIPGYYALAIDDLVAYQGQVIIH